MNDCIKELLECLLKDEDFGSEIDETIFFCDYFREAVEYIRLYSNCPVYSQLQTSFVSKVCSLLKTRIVLLHCIND